MEINITCPMHICSETGRPYYYMESIRVYGTPNFEVPKEYRRYINQCGDIYHAYTTRRFEDWYKGNQMSVLSFLDGYPKWSDIWRCFENDFDWTEVEHDEFKKALTWFADYGIDFVVVWT